MILQKLRTEKGLTQTELSEKLGIKKSTVSHYETGRRIPNLKIAMSIAEFFKVSLDYLLELKWVKTLTENQQKLFDALYECDMSILTFTDIAELIEEMKKHVDELTERRTRSYGRLI